jgi:uncharacterized protein with HEPN domain
LIGIARPAGTLPFSRASSPPADPQIWPLFQDEVLAARRALAVVTCDSNPHMLDAARGHRFASGRASKNWAHNRMLGSLVKCVEILGEVASRTDATHESLPEFVARHHLHAEPVDSRYFDIDTTIVWKTVTMELPPLEHALEKVLQ